MVFLTQVESVSFSMDAPAQQYKRTQAIKDDADDDDGNDCTVLDQSRTRYCLSYRSVPGLGSKK